MAKPIEMKPQPRDAREQLQRRLDSAPIEHADALLSLYDLLQKLHDSGTLDLLRGAVGASDDIVKRSVDMLIQPEPVRAIRNLLLFGKLLGSMDPDMLHRISTALPSAISQADADETPSTLTVLARFRSKESRRALAAGAAILESIGRELDDKKK
ncbi:DUF1641 domain-containing protein [Alloacidobacterium sp.]|uniref:DUF1641 domain-containing protein n=1 Tax=Alloacidobacterium sp. TaxID=2951999 RepID=UPI002D69548C|nr:DUF1641 domain-containing protein [Alloacidobacterium sp.]HYK35260.1 DUF1641 domain-containing protein [Alloacidobacterium sp.]